MLVLDTEALPAGDRAEAFQATVSANCSSSAATFEDTAGLRAEMHVHDLGPGRVFTIDATGTTLRRTPRMARAAGDTARVQAYVRHHLRDPDLGPARIAAANGLSLRALYKLYEGLGVSLEKSIIEQRLQGARTDLAAPLPRHASIAATARAWGFSNPSFFASRFREAYGLTPREWRDRHGAAGPVHAGDRTAHRRATARAAPVPESPARTRG